MYIKSSKMFVTILLIELSFKKVQQYSYMHEYGYCNVILE